jgi:hypothetical protein
LTSTRHAITWRTLIPLALALLLLILIYTPTLLTQPGSGENAYMDDVGEIQVALNVWGTIHHTGYPLYTILGNVAVSVLRSVGFSPATAPALYSLGWGLMALTVFYLLIVRLTGSALLAAAAALTLALLRSVWIHNVIAEVYSMTLALQIILLALALWSPPAPGDVPRRVWLLALVGGFAVAHHRMVAFMAPGLLLAVAPALIAIGWRRALVTLAAALPIGLLGFVPYLYLPARALAGAIWVYGDPGTLPGFWHEFSGAEAAFLLQLPSDSAALMADIGNTFRIIAAEMTPPLAVAGGLLLAWAAIRSPWRREAQVATLCAAGYVAFLAAFHRAVMPEAVTMFITLILTLALALGLARLTDALGSRRSSPRWPALAPLGAAAVACALLIPAHFEPIQALTHDDSGVAAIAAARRVPRDAGRAVLMLPWSSRHTAVGFSIHVTGENADLRLVTHNADLGVLVAAGHTLYTFRDTFYRFPPEWWAARIGGAALSSPADEVVAVRPAPLIGDLPPEAIPVAEGIVLRAARLCRMEDTSQLAIVWQASEAPGADLSVFVHLISGEDPTPLAQADSSAPVYGWHPTSRWMPGEIVEEHYRLPSVPGGDRVAFGFYAQLAPGIFEDYPAAILSLDEAPECPVAPGARPG